MSQTVLENNVFCNNIKTNDHYTKNPEKKDEAFEKPDFCNKVGLGELLCNLKRLGNVISLLKFFRRCNKSFQKAANLC